MLYASFALLALACVGTRGLQLSKAPAVSKAFPFISGIDVSRTTPRGGNITHIGKGIFSPPNAKGNFESFPSSVAPPSNITQTVGSDTSLNQSPTATAAAPSSSPNRPGDIQSTTILLCEKSGCTSCFGITLPLQQGTCFTLDLEPSGTEFRFVSVAISQPGGGGLPYSVLVGPAGCGSFALAPQVNTCFEIPDGPYADFLLN